MSRWYLHFECKCKKVMAVLSSVVRSLTAAVTQGVTIKTIKWMTRSSVWADLNFCYFSCDLLSFCDGVKMCAWAVEEKYSTAHSLSLSLVFLCNEKQKQQQLGGQLLSFTSQCPARTDRCALLRGGSTQTSPHVTCTYVQWAHIAKPEH